MVVRLARSSWADRRGLHQKCSLMIMRRHTTEDADWFEEDVSCVGADEVFSRIINVHKCVEGKLYRVLMCNESRDWETGYVEDWDYQLIPYDPTEKTV